ncbi:CPBP family intramembrane glutamic endopeptidase [Chamaesiphon sp. VAR_48_metabat_135_sub]|uniref:CPBP family intramembrane glutamic endopeptidase n=1 Tax=Chamaesiphon sp. VAR_48_metabat_135_sub TaxID=2964699 RepID=UPI00286AC8DD|nr:CPBP family intramembrane glutamic endopeptidase [Chamaesiphon sp. VAR_48_metabat_135_sub]
MSNSQNPEIEPLSRIQILIAMAVTSIILFGIAKLWLYFGDLQLRPLTMTVVDLGMGIALGLGLTGLSTIVYAVWATYRESADFYLAMVLKPLAVPDLIWLGLLPGLSEELLFRGVMLPALGLDPIGIVLSSLCFGVLHMTNIQQWPYAVWATIVGMILAFTMVETGNLFVPIVAHITTNFISGLTWKLKKLKVET